MYHATPIFVRAYSLPAQLHRYANFLLIITCHPLHRQMRNLSLRLMWRSCGMRYTLPSARRTPTRTHARTHTKPRRCLKRLTRSPTRPHIPAHRDVEPPVTSPAWTRWTLSTLKQTVVLMTGPSTPVLLLAKIDSVDTLIPASSGT